MEGKQIKSSEHGTYQVFVVIQRIPMYGGGSLFSSGDLLEVGGETYLHRSILHEIVMC